jgi:hypothetical protein
MAPTPAAQGHRLGSLEPIRVAADTLHAECTCAGIPVWPESRGCWVLEGGGGRGGGWAGDRDGWEGGGMGGVKRWSQRGGLRCRPASRVCPGPRPGRCQAGKRQRLILLALLAVGGDGRAGQCILGQSRKPRCSVDKSGRARLPRQSRLPLLSQLPLRSRRPRQSICHGVTYASANTSAATVTSASDDD